MKYTLKKSKSKSFLYFQNNIAKEVNNEFESLTGYSSEDLLGKSISEINKILLMNSQVKLEDIDTEFRCYIFTKAYESREVNISCKRNLTRNDIEYSFKEIRNSRLEDNYPYLSSILPDDEMAVAIYSVPDGILLKANKKYVRYLDILCNNNSNKIGRALSEFIDGYEDSKYEKHITTVIKTGIPIYFRDHNDYAYQEGNQYWDGSLVPIYLNGKIKYIIHTGIDVTERVISRKIVHKQKQELEKQNRELETIIENMSDELLIFNEDGEFTKVNRAARANPIIEYKNKYTIDDILGQSNLYDIDGNIILDENMPYKRVIRGEKIDNLRIVKNNTKGILHKEINGTPIYDNEGNFIAGVLVLRDLADRIKYEENLLIKAQFESVTKIIENLELGFLRITYPDFIIKDINKHYYNHLVFTNSRIMQLPNIKGQCIKDNIIFDEGNNLINDIQDGISKNKKVFSCIKKYKISNEEKYYKFIYQPIYDLNNCIIEVIVTDIDITKEEKEKEKMAKALKIQDEIYSNVSHELKTPLNVVFSANQMIDLYLKKDLIEDNKDKLIIYNRIIKQNCLRQTKLLNNILDLSKSKYGKLKLNLSNENIINIVKDIVKSVSEYVKSKELKIIFDTNVEQRIIACDPTMIERIMLNLISNAIKFSNSEGEIYVTVLDKGGTIEISVEDTGTGIEKKHLDLIFQRFYQVDKSLSRNAEGTGIGLSLIKSMIELHGGNISVESEVGKGSIFKVELPANTIEVSEFTEHNRNNVNIDNKIEMINIEFSDIYCND